MGEDVLLYWKGLLQSKNKSKQLNVLQEMVDFFNNVQEEKKEIIYVKFINQDLSYVLSEILIYQHRIVTNLAIKIICHLSEVPEFYNNDFYRYIRSGLRLINSFSKEYISDHDQNEADYKRNILNFNTIMLKRAQIFNVNFNDVRIAKLSLLITASSLTCLDSKIAEKLNFVNEALEVLASVEIENSNKMFQLKKLIEIMKNLKFSKHDMLCSEYLVMLSKFFHKIIPFIPESSNQNSDEILLINAVADKLMTVMRFILEDLQNFSSNLFEFFLNLIYYILTVKALSCVKYMFLSYFLMLNGLNLLIYLATGGISTTSKIIEFKSRAVIAEIMLQILKIFLLIREDDECFDTLRLKYLEITFNCDFNLQNVSLQNIDDLSRETLLFVVFKYYVMLKWNKMKKSKGEWLSTMAFIIETLKSRRSAMDKGLVTMLCCIYTSNFVNMKVKGNELLENSSSTLLKYISKVNIIIDFKFFKWWYLRNWKDTEAYEKIVKFLISPSSGEQFNDLCDEDLIAFDLKFLLQLFIKENLPMENTFKLTKIICSMSPNMGDLDRLVNLYERQRSNTDRRKSINVLKILCSNNRKLTIKMKQTICKLASKTLKDCRNMQERILAIELLVNMTERK